MVNKQAKRMHTTLRGHKEPIQYLPKRSENSKKYGTLQEQGLFIFVQLKKGPEMVTIDYFHRKRAVVNVFEVCCSRPLRDHLLCFCLEDSVCVVCRIFLKNQKKDTLPRNNREQDLLCFF